jgi:hypothetical protein
MQKRSKEFMELTGATLPLVGGISAAVVGAIFSANVINLNAGTVVEGVHGLNPWLYLVIGFLAGFSERFTRSVLSVAESKFGGAGNVQQIGQPPAVLKSDMLNVDITKTDSQVEGQKASG